MKTRPSLGELAALALLGIPVVGVLLGGVYFFPILWLTRGRDPFLTLGLSVALAVPVVVMGMAARVATGWMVLAWLLAVATLLARRAFGPLSGNVERFGVVHAFVLVLSGTLATALRAH